MIYINAILQRIFSASNLAIILFSIITNQVEIVINQSKPFLSLNFDLKKTS